MPGDERSTLLARYDRWCRRGARTEWVLVFFAEAMSAALAALLMLSAVIVPVTLWDSGNLGRVLLVGELVAVVASGIATFPLIAETRADRISVGFAMTALAVAVAVTLTLGGPWTISVGATSVAWSSRLGLLILLGSCLLMVCYIIVLGFAGSLSTSLFGKSISRRAGEELAFYSLALVLAQLVDHAPGERRLPSTGRLQSAAAYVERLGRDVHLADARHRRVFRARIRSAAQAVRETALWVALPKADTQAALRSFVVELMTAVLDGTYDELPAAPAERWRRVKAVAVFLRTLVIGALPAGILWLVHRLGVQLPDPVGATATLFAVLWAIVTVLMAMDPALRERADLVRSVTGLLSGSKPEK